MVFTDWLSIIAALGVDSPSAASRTLGRKASWRLFQVPSWDPLRMPTLRVSTASFRDECLNQHWFGNLQEAARMIEEWRIDYNLTRPHSSLGYLAPETFRQQQKLSLSVV